MDPSTPPVVSTVVTNPEPPPKKHGKAVSLVTLLVVLVAAGSGYGAYYWQHQKVLSLQTAAAQPAKSMPAMAAKSQPAAADAVNVGQSYPLSIPDKQVTSTLALPAGYNILQLEPTTGSQDALVGYYTETMNDLMGHWVFNNKGTTQNPSGSLDNYGEIDLSALGKWLQVNDAPGVSYPDGTGPMTTTQKTSFVANLKTTTAACATDSSKGFATSDHVYNICYTLEHPQAEGANWGFNFSGYGEIDGSPTYVRGGLELPNTGSSYQASLSSFIAALKQFKTTIAKNPNTP